MKKLTGILIAICMLALTLAGCGGSSGSGGTALRVGWTSEPDTLNPLTSYSTESMQITNIVYEPLLAYDSDLNEYPKLAESYEYSDDGLVATYKLHKDVKWHDGEDFTADDVVFTFNMIKKYEVGPAAVYIDTFDKAVKVDDYTVELHFNQKQAFNIALIALILPEHIWGEMNLEDIELFANSEPIGTGAMKFAGWEEGSTITLTRNEDYYGEPAGADNIIFVEYGNEDVMAQGLQSGEIDVVTELSPTVWESLDGSDNIKAVSLDSMSFHEIGINSYDSDKSKGNPMLLDKTVRQALNYVADRERIVETALAGHGNPGDTIVPPALGDWHYNVPDGDRMNGDIEKAKEMLEAAGYTDSNGDGIREKDGQDMSFRLFAIESTTVDVRAAELFRDMAKKAGIKITITTMDENTMGDTLLDPDNADFDLFVWGWDADNLDPANLPSYFVTGGSDNDCYYSDSAYDKLMVDQQADMDESSRMEKIHEMQKMFYENGSYIVLWYQDKLQAYRTDTFEGWKESPGGLIFNVTYDNYTRVKPIQ